MTSATRHLVVLVLHLISPQVIGRSKRRKPDDEVLLFAKNARLRRKFRSGARDSSRVAPAGCTFNPTVCTMFQAECINTGYSCGSQHESKTAFCQQWVADSICIGAKCVRPARCQRSAESLAASLSATNGTEAGKVEDKLKAEFLLMLGGHNSIAYAQGRLDLLRPTFVWKQLDWKPRTANASKERGKTDLRTAPFVQLAYGCNMKHHDLIPYSASIGPMTIEACQRECVQFDDPGRPRCGAVAFYTLPAVAMDRKGGRRQRKQRGFCNLKSELCLQEKRIEPGPCRLGRTWCVYKRGGLIAHEKKRSECEPLEPFPVAIVDRRPMRQRSWRLRRSQVRQNWTGGLPPSCKNQCHGKCPGACIPVPGSVGRCGCFSKPLRRADGYAAGRRLTELNDPGHPAAKAYDASANNATTYFYTRAVLGGGLNNMLMHVAQLLHSSCEAEAILVLPRLDRDPMSEPWVTKTNDDRPWLPFDHIFNFSFFAGAMAPCRVSRRAPDGAHSVELPHVGLGQGWNFTTLLRRVYMAARPAKQVRLLVDSLMIQARKLAGNHFDAVHLPIEQDWWWDSLWCNPKEYENYTRRCFSPAEVSSLTAPQRRRSRATGTVLMYAADKVHRKGPYVCVGAFGKETHKLQLPLTVDYTYRNAAEQFFAAAAPAGFYGNAYSTFSKGIALLRIGQSGLNGQSFAYDCALHDMQRGTWTYLERSIVANHPGFTELKTLPGLCGGATPGGSDGVLMRDPPPAWWDALDHSAGSPYEYCGDVCQQEAAMDSLKQTRRCEELRTAKGKQMCSSRCCRSYRWYAERDSRSQETALLVREARARARLPGS